MRVICLLFFCVASTLSFAQSAENQAEAVRKKIVAKDFTGAKTDLTKLIEANPKLKLAYNLRGQARMGLDDLYGAIGDFTIALEIDSTYAEPLAFMGEAKLALGDYEGAIADLDRSIRRSPNSADAYTTRGFAKY